MDCQAVANYSQLERKYSQLGTQFDYFRGKLSQTDTAKNRQLD